jgi:putative addiction module killer protein
MYEIEVYRTATDEAPFQAWIESLRDQKAQTRLYARLDRASYGNFGDWKDLTGAKGLFEMRDHYGQGFRIYYSIVGSRIILLLAGSTKSEQNRAIMKAKEYLADYFRRTSS